MARRYNRIVEALNISDISDKYPSELSGGQRQRTSQQEHSLIYLQLYLLMNQQELWILKYSRPTQKIDLYE